MTERGSRGESGDASRGARPAADRTVPLPSTDFRGPNATNPVAIAFGKRLRSIRWREGLSQIEIGQAAGVHRTEISLLERGEREPRIGMILKLSKGLECPPSELIDGLLDWNPNVQGARAIGAWEDPEVESIPLFIQRREARLAAERLHRDQAHEARFPIRENPRAAVAALGEYFKSRRIAGGLTVSALSRRSGVARPSITSIERGGGQPTFETVVRLAIDFGDDPADLIHAVFPSDDAS